MPTILSLSYHHKFFLMFLRPFLKTDFNNHLASFFWNGITERHMKSLFLSFKEHIAYN